MTTPTGEPPLELVDLSLETPEENVALDEALLRRLDAAIRAGEPAAGYLRFWESSRHFVCVGVSTALDVDVDRAACRAADVPIIRRASGGGTVVQGPGCLNFAVVLPLAREPGLRDIHRSYEAIVGRSAAALGTGAERHGDSDLAIAARKFGGSAQKRTPHALLHHATVLWGFDLDRIPSLLREPPVQPEYRQGRSHLDFVRNLPLAPAEIRDRLAAAWDARPPRRGPEIPDLTALIDEKYGNPAWNERF